MTWNWQLPEWPDFRWNVEVLAPPEARFMQQSGVQIGSIRHFDEEARPHILVDILTSEALKTSEIEGEILNRNSVQASILRHFGMGTDHRRIPPAERGISDLLFDLHRNFDQQLTEDTLHRWHVMVTAGRTDLHDIGRYRTHGDPMQVVSGAIQQDGQDGGQEPEKPGGAQGRSFNLQVVRSILAAVVATQLGGGI